MEPIIINEKVLRDAVKNEVTQIEQALAHFKCTISEEVFVSCCERKSEVLNLGLEKKSKQQHEHFAFAGWI